MASMPMCDTFKTDKCDTDVLEISTKIVLFQSPKRRSGPCANFGVFIDLVSGYRGRKNEACGSFILATKKEIFARFSTLQGEQRVVSDQKELDTVFLSLVNRQQLKSLP